MKKIFIFIIIVINLNANLIGQQDSIEFLFRDWYANGYGDKSVNIGETIAFDTISLDTKDNNNFKKWRFERNGKFIDLIVHKINWDNKENIIEMSDDNVKWTFNKVTRELTIANEDFNVKYKILRISKSELKLQKTEELH